MKKTEFIKTLRKQLEQIPKEEREEFIADYDDHIKMGMKKGRKEAAIIKALGDPKSIAKQIRADYRVQKAEHTKSLSNLSRAILATAGLGFFNIVFILGPFMGILGALAGLFAGSLAIVFSGVAVIAAGIVAPILSTIPWFAGIGTMLAGIGLICLGLLWFIFNMYLGKWLFKGTLVYLKWNIDIVRGDKK